MDGALAEGNGRSRHPLSVALATGNRAFWSLAAGRSEAREQQLLLFTRLKAACRLPAQFR